MAFPAWLYKSKIWLMKGNAVSLFLLGFPVTTLFSYLVVLMTTVFSLKITFRSSSNAFIFVVGIIVNTNIAVDFVHVFEIVSTLLFFLSFVSMAV